MDIFLDLTFRVHHTIKRKFYLLYTTVNNYLNIKKLIGTNRLSILLVMYTCNYNNGFMVIIIYTWKLWKFLIIITVFILVKINSLLLSSEFSISLIYRCGFTNSLTASKYPFRRPIDGRAARKQKCSFLDQNGLRICRASSHGIIIMFIVGFL